MRLSGRMEKEKPRPSASLRAGFLAKNARHGTPATFLFSTVSGLNPSLQASRRTQRWGSLGRGGANAGHPPRLQYVDDEGSVSVNREGRFYS
jgi:hypothetical protein